MNGMNDILTAVCNGVGGRFIVIINNTTKNQTFVQEATT
jgi:hypothetical protein